MFDASAIDGIRDVLLGKKEKVAVSESVTSGFLQAAFSTAELALQFFEGGITTYNIDQKARHLHINRQNAEECNCVSEQTANEMAIGVRKLFGSDWAISVTGYATAVPESDNKLFAIFSICKGDEIKMNERMDLTNEKPEEAQLKYVNIILKKFSSLLAG